jgi:hypothetical protein
MRRQSESSSSAAQQHSMFSCFLTRTQRGEVCIRVRAAAISPTDPGLRSGGYDTTGEEPRRFPAWTA